MLTLKGARLSDDAKKYTQILSGVSLPAVEEALESMQTLQREIAYAHSASYTDNSLDGTEINFIEWPLQVPDLNNVESFSGYLNCMIYKNIRTNW